MKARINPDMIAWNKVIIDLYKSFRSNGDSETILKAIVMLKEYMWTHMAPTNFLEFQQSGLHVPLYWAQGPMKMDGLEPYNKACIVLVYAWGGHIIYDPDKGIYWCTVENDSMRSYYLQEAEEFLWDRWCKQNISYSAQEDDLHQRAKEIVELAGEECSLDEVDWMLYPDYMGRAKYIQREFQQLNNRRVAMPESNSNNKA